ncbi:MAG: hypothetical protein HY691_03625 [Chloroflexi bacterium]|nr:hypothetical protein [Chloroflexota bacterium]
MADSSRAIPEPVNPQAAFLEALARMERAVLDDLRHRAPAGLTATGDSTAALQRLEDRITELHVLLKQTGERAEWQQEQALEAMTREVRGLRNDLHGFVRLMAAAVVTLVVVLALLVLFRVR